jgi:hypothetical protein
MAIVLALIGCFSAPTAPEAPRLAADATWSWTATGWASSIVGDLNADGRPDLIGLPRVDPGCRGAGSREQARLISAAPKRYVLRLQ